MFFQASVEKNLDKLSALVDSKKFTAHAQAILVSETAVPNVSKLSIKDKKVCIFLLSSGIITEQCFCSFYWFLPIFNLS